MLEKFCKENNFCGWFYTSAKENTNIEESAKFLVGKVCILSYRFFLSIVLIELNPFSFHFNRFSKNIDSTKTKTFCIGRCCR